MRVALLCGAGGACVKLGKIEIVMDGWDLHHPLRKVPDCARRMFCACPPTFHCVLPRRAGGAAPDKAARGLCMAAQPGAAALAPLVDEGGPGPGSIALLWGSALLAAAGAACLAAAAPGSAGPDASREAGGEGGCAASVLHHRQQQQQQPPAAHTRRSGTSDGAAWWSRPSASGLHTGLALASALAPLAHAEAATRPVNTTTTTSGAILPAAAPINASTAPLIALAAPLALYSAGQGPRLGPEAYDQLQAAALSSWAELRPPQLAAIAWALAWAGHPFQPAFRTRVEAALRSGSTSDPGSAGGAGLPGSSSFGFGGGPAASPGPAHSQPAAPELAVMLWSLAMQGGVAPELWRTAVARVAAAAPPELDECLALYLLHAAMLCAGSVTSSSSSGAAAAPALAAGAAATAPPPRASLEEVEALLGPLGRKARARVAAAYHE